jgi:hypothetical protein
MGFTSQARMESFLFDLIPYIPLCISDNLVDRHDTVRIAQRDRESHSHDGVRPQRTTLTPPPPGGSLGVPREGGRYREARRARQPTAPLAQEEGTGTGDSHLLDGGPPLFLDNSIAAARAREHAPGRSTQSQIPHGSHDLSQSRDGAPGNMRHIRSESQSGNAK